MSKEKFTKDTIPEDFTMAMVLVDLIPVLFFGGTGIVLGLILGNIIVEIAAVVVFLSGLLKVLWKLIVVLKQKNVWSLFVQMRIVMPFAFLIVVIGTIYSVITNKALHLLAAFTAMPQLLLFVGGFIGMSLMVVCAVKLDSADSKSNWIEQIINSVAQALFFIGMLLVYMK